MADKRIPRSAIITAWRKPGATGASIAKAVGLSHSQACRRARDIGLAIKARGRPSRFDDATFAAMWNAGVVRADIAAAFDTSPTYVTAIAKRLDLPSRKHGSTRKLTAEEFDQTRLGIAMAATAAAEQAAMINAEMADGCGSAGMLVGAKHARAA